MEAKIRKIKVLESNEIVHKIQVRKWFVWLTEFESHSQEKADKQYQKLLRCDNIKEVGK